MSMRRGKDGLTKGLKDAYATLGMPNFLSAIQYVYDNGYSLKQIDYQMVQLEKLGFLKLIDGKWVLLPLVTAEGEGDGARTAV